ncbi:MAG: FAD-dependent oxidoreductase, partial [Bacteriovorax sp.]|nr:FAD-dependent oxidoreductase [Bacteriovorax sp.]
MEKDFRVIKPKLTKIIIVEAGTKILGGFNHALSKQALIDLNSLGVEVLLETRVTGIDSSGVRIKTSEGEMTIEAATVLWAAGVKPSPLNKFLKEELDSTGRVHVTENLSLKSHREVYAIGDQVHFETETRKILPGLAPVAIQMGEHAAKNIIRQIRGEMVLPFTYKDKGQMATIGRRLAVMEYKTFKARGMFAWLAWL